MLRILHTNDFHGKLDDDRQAVLRKLRSECDLYFDCGDAIKTGNLGIPLRADDVWPRLSSLECTASVLGWETHILPAPFAKKIEGHSHPVLCANLHLKSGEHPLPGFIKVEVGALKVGVIGVMVAMVSPSMAISAASAYLWDPPIATSVTLAEALRDEVDCLIALTHIGLRQDRLLAERCPLFDLILGGHSHDVLVQPEMIGKTAICQTGSHGHFAGVYEWAAGLGLTSCKLVPLPVS